MSSFDFSYHVREYHQYQSRLGDQISMKMMETMSDNEMMMAAKKLQMVYKNILMFDRETETEILMEFALFSHLHAFGSIALRWCSQHTPADTMEACIFAGVQASFYSLFRVLKIFPSKGVLLQDTFTKKEFPLMDISISRSAQVNMGIAGRIIPIHDWGMLTGAIIPVVNQTYHALEPYLQKNIQSDMIGQDQPFFGKKEMSFQATIISTAIANGCFENMGFQEQ